MNDNANLNRQPELYRTRRLGFTTIELVVSAVVLITVMSFVTSMCFRINLIWKDVGQHRIAIGELSNHLDNLTRLSPEKAKLTLEDIEPSRECAITLNRPVLKGQLIEDEFGNRIEIQIDWKRRNPGKPVRLVGWLMPPASENESSASMSTDGSVASIGNAEPSSVGFRAEELE